MTTFVDDGIRLLGTRTPCCGRKLRFPVRMPTYERVCPKCGAKYVVTRSVAQVGARMHLAVDRLDWTAAP